MMKRLLNCICIPGRACVERSVTRVRRLNVAGKWAGLGLWPTAAGPTCVYSSAFGGTGFRVECTAYHLGWGCCCVWQLPTMNLDSPGSESNLAQGNPRHLITAVAQLVGRYCTHITAKKKLTRSDVFLHPFTAKKLCTA